MNADDLDPAVDYIFTIGHSNTAFEALLENLRAYSIEAVADVRSQPASRYTPHFNRSELTWQLQEAGIRYAFMGDTLGGRPAGAEYYDGEGHVRYDLWSATDAFRDGIEKLKGAAVRRRVAVLCSEEDPEACHRHLLIARVLNGDGWPGTRVVHIRGDASCVLDSEIPVQQDLFGGEVGWRSPRSVLPKVRPSASSSGFAQPESDDW
jgi:uncharacterized protein (DUF488 family)